MEKFKFTTDGLTATPHSSVEDKAKFLNDLANFVRDGFSAKKFTQSLYRRLSMCFGHIAHTNINGFYVAWFETPKCQQEWTRRICDKSIFGDPAFTYSDAETKFKEWLQSKEGLAIRDALHQQVIDDDRFATIKSAKLFMSRLTPEDRQDVWDSFQ